VAKWKQFKNVIEKELELVMTPSAKTEGFSQEQLSPLKGT